MFKKIPALLFALALICLGAGMIQGTLLHGLSAHIRGTLGFVIIMTGFGFGTRFYRSVRKKGQ